MEHAAFLGLQVSYTLRNRHVDLLEGSLGLILRLFFGFLDKFKVHTGSFAPIHLHQQRVSLRFFNELIGFLEQLGSE